MIREVDPKKLDELISKNNIVFVDFWANWCAPCKQFAYVYDEVASKYPDILFTKINIEDHPSISNTLEIQSIPHLIIFKNEIIIYSDSGSMPESTLQDLVEQSIKIDLNEISKNLEDK